MMHRQEYMEQNDSSMRVMGLLCINLNRICTISTILIQYLYSSKRPVSDYSNMIKLLHFVKRYIYVVPYSLLTKNNHYNSHYS